MVKNGGNENENVDNQRLARKEREHGHYKNTRGYLCK